VVKEAIQVAINKGLGIGSAWSILTMVLDTIPGVGDFIGMIGVGIEGTIETVGANAALAWVEGQADAALWSAIGCDVFEGVKSVHKFTDTNLASIVANIRTIGGPFGFLANAVADYLEGLGAAALNGITSVANLKSYDCSSCSGPIVAPTDNTGPVLMPHVLVVTDGANTFEGVRELTFSGATAT